MKNTYVVAFTQFYPETPAETWLEFFTGTNLPEFAWSGPQNAARYTNKAQATRIARRLGAKVYRSQGGNWHPAMPETFIPA